MNRRRFVQSTLTAASALSWSQVRSATTTRPLRILVLGGTNFVGPAIVEQALSQGHQVTLFNRGITRPELFPQLEKIRGDRRAGPSGLAALTGKREWDAVVDVWPAEAGLVESTARLLKDRVGYYCFVSSVAVYDSFASKGLTESDPLRWSDAGYGGEKARCERLLAELFPDRSSAMRCHSIFGPRDPGSSLHYWLRSLAHNARQIAPGPGDDPVQFVDVRDVAAWVMASISEQRTGPWNLAGAPITFRALSMAPVALVSPKQRLSGQMPGFCFLRASACSRNCRCGFRFDKTLSRAFFRSARTKPGPLDLPLGRST